jgi:kynurenine formamidase
MNVIKLNNWLCRGLPVLCLVSTTALADCDRYSQLKGKAWVDGDCMETPLGERWWPHPRWGEGDEAGSTNWYSQPEVVERALSTVKQGRVARIGQDYQTEMPLFGARQFTLRIPGAPTGGVVGANRAIWMDEFLATEVSQVGTQFDGLGHIGVATGSDGDKAQMRFYNGFTGQQILDPYGLKHLGSEKLYPIVARGVLIDVAAARGVESMAAGEVITMVDVRAALKRQGLGDFELKPGDAVLFRTGWERYWIEDNDKYNNGCPGIGIEVARWLAKGEVGVTGADTWPVEAVPNPDPECAFCVHTFLQTRHGIVNQENLKLAALAAEGVHLFAYLYSPVPIVGATGSIGSPVVMW